MFLYDIQRHSIYLITEIQINQRFTCDQPCLTDVQNEESSGWPKL